MVTRFDSMRAPRFDSLASAATASEPAEVNARLLQPLARYLAKHRGAEVARDVARSAGLKPEDLDGRSRWMSLRRFEAMLAAARELVDDDDEFERATSFELKESWGAIRFALLATTVGHVFELSAKTIQMVSTVSAYAVERTASNAATMRYTTKRRESRLMCLSRHGALTALPTIFGLPRAQLTETSCVANGDACCEYHLRWHEQRRWLPGILGGASGVVLALALTHLAVTSSWFVLPFLGWALGHLHEYRRTNVSNLALGEEMNAALRESLRDDTEARRELLELHQRQNQWAKLMEQQVAERTATLSEVVERVQAIQQKRASKVLGFSHDLRSPLAVLTMNASMLRDCVGDSREPLELIDDLEEAGKRMVVMLEELVTTAKAETVLVQLAPQQLDVPPLVERLRRRLRALAHGRDIRVSVFATREAPDSIETDALVFDRVVDNLLTNAAKYTERGSIVVEVGGIPGFLTIKVSDTGKGIEPTRVDKIFQAGGTEPRDRASNSFGVGLSVVVQLLGQIGGRLDVMSKPSSGTTFWAHFPVESQAPRRVPSGEREGISQVVTVRKAEGT